jgi:hypothetical protein
MEFKLQKLEVVVAAVVAAAERYLGVPRLEDLQGVLSGDPSFQAVGLK